MENESRVLRQPFSHLCMTVGSVVVQDEVQFFLRRELFIQASKEAEESLMTMALIALPDDASLRHLQCGKKRCRAMAFVVMSERAASPGFHRQSRLRAIQGLYLALFIDAENHCILRRRHVDADHIGQFLHELRVARELKGACEMRLEVVIVPNALNGAFTDTLRLGHGARAPVRGRTRLVLKGGLNHPGHTCFVVSNLSSATRSNLPNCANALLSDAAAP